MCRSLAILALFAAALLGACRHASPAIPAESGTSITGIMLQNCGSCHSRSHSEDVPEALAVYDLDDPDWLAGVPSDKFYAFLPRLLPLVDAATAEKVRVVLDAELARRQID